MFRQFRLIFLGVLAAVVVSGCTTTDPYTGQTTVDPNSTAALLGGLALGGAAGYALSRDDNNDDNNNDNVYYPYTDGNRYRSDQNYGDRYRGNRYYDDRHRNDDRHRHRNDDDRSRHLGSLSEARKGTRSPRPGIVCYDDRRACYTPSGNYQENWTRRVYRGRAR